MPRPRTSRDASCNSNSPGNTTKDWNAVLYQFALGSQEAMADIDCSSFTLSSTSSNNTAPTARKHRHHQEAPRSCPPDLSSLSSAPPAVRSCSQSTSSSANTDLSSAFRENGNYCYSDNGSSTTQNAANNLCGDCISPTVQQQQREASGHKSNGGKNGGRANKQSQQQAQQQLAGETSPSSVCGQRKMSAAVVTTLDAKHDFLEGRPKILATQPAQPPARSRSSGGFVSSMTTSFRSGSRSPTKTKKDKKSPTNSPKQQQQQRQQQLQLLQLQQRRSKQQNVPYLGQPEPLRLDAWEEAPLTENVKVRGKNYLTDGKKIPASDQGAAFDLLTVDMIKSDEPILTGLCSHPAERIQRALQRERDAGKRELPSFVFAVNLCLPSADGGYYHCVSYFGTDDVAALSDPNTPFGRVAKRFFFGSSNDEDDAFRDATFKLIPRIEDGNFVVRKAVGTKPSILGNKIKQYYVRNERYFELVVHVGSDPLAQSIVKMALTYAKQLVVDMLFVLEGATEDALPERLLGGVRLSNVDFKSRDGQRIVRVPAAATSAAERPEE